MATLLLILVSLLKLFGLLLLLAILTSPITIPVLFFIMKLCGKGHIVKSWITRWNAAHQKSPSHHKVMEFQEINPATGLLMIGNIDTGGNIGGTSSNSDYYNNHHKH